MCLFELMLLKVVMIRNMKYKLEKQKSEPRRLSPGLGIPERLCSLQSFQPANKKRKFFAKILFLVVVFPNNGQNDTFHASCIPVNCGETGIQLTQNMNRNPDV